MKEIHNVSIIGMGALGLLFGTPIRENLGNGQPQYIMDAERKARHEKEVYTINEKEVHLHMVTPEEAEPADLLLVGLKYPALKAGLETAAPCVNEDTIIISLMNGVDSEEIIGERFGKEKVLYSVSQEMDAQRYGSEMVYSQAGRLFVGVPHTADAETQKILTEKLDRVCAFFDQVKFPYKREENILYRQWCKYMVNTGCNQTTMVFDKPYGECLKDGSLEYAVMISAMREVCLIAQKKGIPVGEKELHEYTDILRGLDPNAVPSMGQDRRQKRKSEVDMFSGTIMRYGKELGVATPANDYLNRRVHEIESGY